MITKFKLFEYVKEPVIEAGDKITIHDEQVYLDKREVMITTDPYVETGRNNFSNEEQNWYVDFVDLKTKERGTAILVKPIAPVGYKGEVKDMWVFFKWDDPFKMMSN